MVSKQTFLWMECAGGCKIAGQYAGDQIGPCCHCNPMTKNRDHESDLLLHELAEARDDDRYMFAQYVAIVSAALVVIGAMATVFSQTCLAGYSNCAADGKMGAPISIWIYIGAPLLPIALVSYAVFISAILTLRSYYLRTLERRVHQ